MTKPLKIEVGQVFSFMTVIEPNARNDKNRRVVLLRCVCGVEIRVNPSDLKVQKSCGCMRSALIAKSRTKHGGRINKKNPVYSAWCNMRARCYNPKNSHYKYYGGRGITACDEWLSDYAKFASDMGDRPNGTSIERVNGSLGYSKANCIWATSHEQALNRPGHEKWVPVSWMGAEYPSLTRASSATGVSRKEIQKALGILPQSKP